ncbi:hypothetical protein [Oricola cellulosilytica]|uniref:Uncharacterized protein n=1 Tax=Oricola cellulosilytica TaxID=1429082 RepID=A0A4R0P6H7_9HYPH|nr:hypothetical protein [Oricola cellulosilytica]TCD12319.1 hypothetical protein E0D97_14965 [Oricola cellulosilytica]
MVELFGHDSCCTVLVFVCRDPRPVKDGYVQIASVKVGGYQYRSDFKGAGVRAMNDCDKPI